MSSIFICHTAYHVYISCIKAMLSNESSIDILLLDSIPEVDAIGERVRNSDIFNDVRVVHHNELLPKFSKKSFHETIILMPFFMKKVDLQLKYILKYDDIYIYTDYSNIGAYLMWKKRKYHLLEDACNTFRRNVHEYQGSCILLKKILYYFFRIPHAMGMCSLCMDVEVNDANIVKTMFKCPVYELNKEILTSKLDKEQINKLLDIFFISIKKSNGRKRLLLLTDPLRESKEYSSDDDIRTHYKRILEPYTHQYEIFIKPHPRDEVDYSTMFCKKISIIDRTVPAEIFTYIEACSFDMILVNSGSTVYFAMKKICENVIYV